MHERILELELVGVGSMAEVRRGILRGERATGRTVAVKRLRSDLRADPAFVDLFVAEAQLAVQIHHPHVVHALELGKDHQGYYLVCEWVAGSTLAALHQGWGAIPVSSVLDMGQQLCAALTYLHEFKGADGGVLGIVHRDVSPKNIFVTEQGDLKLGDLGVAQHAAARGFEHLAAGTPGFAAPEQLKGSAVDHRADIYSLAATLQYMCSEIDSKELGAILRRGQEARPEARWASAREFAQALQALGQTLQSDPQALRGFLRDRGGLPKPRATTAPSALDENLRRLLANSADSLPSQSLPLTSRRVRKRTRPGYSIGLLVLMILAMVLAARIAMHNPTSGALPAADNAARTTRPEGATVGPEVPPTPNSGAHTLQTKKVLAPGVVSINSYPWAEVLMHGKKLGNTPIRELRMDRGKHRIVLRHPPLQLQRVVELAVEAGKRQTLFVNLHDGSTQRRVE